MIMNENNWKMIDTFDDIEFLHVSVWEAVEKLVGPDENEIDFQYNAILDMIWKQVPPAEMSVVFFMTINPVLGSMKNI